MLSNHSYQGTKHEKSTFIDTTHTKQRHISYDTKRYKNLPGQTRKTLASLGQRQRKESNLHTTQIL